MTGNKALFPCLAGRCVMVTAMLLVIFLAGCKKNQQIDLKPNLNVANDLVLSTRPVVYSFRMLFRAVNDSLLQSTRHATIDGASVSLNAARTQYTFSYSGGYCTDSVVRHGSLRATVDSGFYHKGSVIIIDFQGFFEDSHLVTGRDSITCTGLQDGIYTYRGYINNATVRKDSVRIIQFGAEYGMQIVPNLLVQGILQTAIQFEGLSNGVSSDGHSFTSETPDPVTVYEACPWIAFGKIAFAVQGAAVPTGTIEFMGKDDCSDRVDYDFEGSVNHTWMKEQFLRN